MRIDSTAFGEITINGKTYDHDVIIRLSGEIVKRKRNCRRSCTAPHTLCRRMRQNSCLKRGVDNSSLVQAKTGTCSSLRRQMLSSPRRTARLLFSRRRRPFAPLMKHMERKSVCST